MFDPNLPQENTPLDAAQMRAQLNALNDKIDTKLPGPPGTPGEVSSAQLSAAISGTSANTNSIALLNMLVSDPPTQAEVQAIASKIDAVILNGWR